MTLDDETILKSALNSVALIEHKQLAVQTMEQVVARSLFSQRLTTGVMLIWRRRIIDRDGWDVRANLICRQSAHPRTGNSAGFGRKYHRCVAPGHLAGLEADALRSVIGLASSFALMRILKSLLFGVSPADPLTFATIVLLLPAVSGLACWIPARPRNQS
jgi:hypothetical protein